MPHFTQRWIAAGLCVAVLAAPAAGQVGHPAKGSWIGYWGPNEAEQRRILLLLDWEDRQIVGTINPGRDSTPVSRAEVDYDTWTMTVEAEMPVEGGGTERLVVVGQLANLGSWVNRRYTGTYRFGEETGEFALTMN